MFKEFIELFGIPVDNKHILFPKHKQISVIKRLIFICHRNFDAKFATSFADRHNVIVFIMEEVTLHEEELDLIKEEDIRDEKSEVAELKVTDDDDDPGVVCSLNEGDPESKKDVELDAEQSNDICKEVEEEDLLTKMIAKLKVLELQNIEYVNETENQKKVIEMLRLEVSKKDEENHSVQKDLKISKETLESKYNKLQK